MPIYRLTRFLGEGGIGRVYLAASPQGPVALKFLGKGRDPKTLHFFREEVRLLSRLSHPNLVRIYDFFEEPEKQDCWVADPGLADPPPRDAPCFAMEFLEGEPLGPRPDLDARAWAAWLAEICSGLAYLHARGILHRDLKPSNIFVTPGGRLKILDFSLSGTPSAGLAGTPAYMPPEAFQGDGDGRSDLFSLGAVAYEGISGQRPFSRPLTASALAASPRPRPLRELQPGVPEYLAELVHRLLALSPADRPSSAAVVWKYLQNRAPEALRSLPAPESGGLERPTLRGREAEWARMREFLTDRGRVCLLTGPTGIGRSRMLEELKWHCLLAGVVFQAVGPGGERVWPLLLRERCALAPGTTDALDPLALAEQLLAAKAGPRLVLSFLDLQDWSPGELRRLKAFLAALHGEPEAPVVFLEHNSDFGTLEVAGAETIVLEDLPETASLEILREAAVLEAMPPVAERELLRSAGGRPLLLLEALRQPGASGEFPKNLREAMVRKWRSLSTPARRLLSEVLAATEPGGFERHAALGEEQDSLAGALLELDAAKILAPRSRERPWLALAHPSLQGIWRETLPASALAEAHRRWLSYGEGVAGTAAALPPDALLEHAFAAADVEAGARWLFPALDELGRRGEFERALRWIDAALARPHPGIDRCRLLAYRAPYSYRLGRYAECLQAYRDWFALRADDSSRLQEVKFHFYSGLAYFSWGKDEAARERLERCLATGDAEAHPALRPYWRRARHLLASLEEKRGDWGKAESLLRAASRLAVEDRLLEGEGEQQWGRISLQLLRLEEARDHLERSLEHYRSTGSPQAEAIGRHGLAALWKERGELLRAAVEMELAWQLARRGGELAQAARYEADLGALWVEAGRYAEGWKALARGESLLRILGGAREYAVCRLQGAVAKLAFGHWAEAEADLTALAREAEDPALASLGPLVRLAQAEMELARGRPAAAASHLREAEAGPATASPALRFQAGFAALRLDLRFGRRGAAPESLDFFLKTLPGMPGPLWAAWRRAWEIFSRPARETAWEELEALAVTAEALESPDAALELLETLRRALAARGLAALAAELRRRMVDPWRRIWKNLPEEWKMDFEKNRSLEEMDRRFAEARGPAEAETAARGHGSSPAASKAGIPEDRFRQFCEIGMQIAKKTRLQDILDRAMDAAIELSGAERGFLILKDAAASGPLPGFSVATARHLSRISIESGEAQLSLSAVRRAIEGGAPLLTDNAQEDDRLRGQQSVHLFQLKSILTLPLEVDGEVLGAIYLDHRYETGCFSKEDIVVVSAFAHQAGLAIQKARLLEELRDAKARLEAQVAEQSERIETLAAELQQKRRKTLLDYPEIIGQSPPMRRVFELLDHVTRTRIPVWIYGESGTGKELVARSLHSNSARKSGPFVSENCGAIPENLLESELFGHKRGAFTHADRDRIGLFEQAQGGTLFLDEVADMSMGMQVKLLRALQEGEIRPLGSERKVKVDVRLVTASNRDLRELVRQGKFREDLFYRINGMTIPLPPLRERREDIPLLVHHLIGKIAKDFDLKPSPVTQEALQALARHDWPGNIRELEGVLRGLLLFSKGKPITGKMLVQHPGLARPEAPAAAAGPVSLEGEMVAERRLLMELLAKHAFDKTRVARELGISLKSVYARIHRLGIPKKRWLLERLAKEEKFL